MEDAPRLGLAGADRHGREIVPGHQLSDRLAWVLGKAHVAIGDDAAQLARFFDHWNAADPVRLHQLERVRERLVGAHGDRVDHHSALEPFYLPNRRRLLLDSEVAVEDADAAELREGDRHVGLGHRVHRR